MASRYIGLMSGTSLDGVDGVLVDFPDGPPSSWRVLAHVHRAFEAPLAAELLALNTPGGNELHRAALAANAVARAYAEVTEALLAAAVLPANAVAAIGAHGQTVRHRPGEFDSTGYTLQLLNASLLAERIGIDVIADLRSRDVAAGGQGAPLVPAFHRALFGRPGSTVAALNLGGIANLTVIGADGSTTGFDCGPANALMDHWSRIHRGLPFDAGGSWAASGHVDESLLTTLMADPFFELAPPKSTGRDRFNPAWLERHLQSLAAPPSAVDVQATLAELTAAVAASAVRAYAAEAAEVIVCGGGARNDHLLGRLRARLPGVGVVASDERGLPAEQVEAFAFAWLARAWDRGEPGNLPAVTGARGPRWLGARYPGG